MNLFKWLFKKRSKQTLWLWCPWCRKDLCSNNSFIKDTDYVYYKCANCGYESKWDFDIAPVPILIEKEAM